MTIWIFSADRCNTSKNHSSRPGSAIYEMVVEDDAAVKALGYRQPKEGRQLLARAHGQGIHLPSVPRGVDAHRLSGWVDLQHPVP